MKAGELLSPFTTANGTRIARRSHVCHSAGCLDRAGGLKGENPTSPTSRSDSAAGRCIHSSTVKRTALCGVKGVPADS